MAMTVVSSPLWPVRVQAEPNADAPIDFNRDIRPILSDKCYFCHGPDEENRQADLRLDRREEAIDYLEAGEVVDRIHQDDPDLLMPPPETNLALSIDDKRLLERWIASGAQYSEHWSFTLLPVSVPIPHVDAEFCRNSIDRFVVAKLKDANLSTSEDASPHRWLRRATLDLTGLPPTPSEIKAFLDTLAARGIEEAYTLTVKRLLSSDAFGEHMAVSWLDAARYADSYGYQSDKLNTQWPYRDWVVRAFNENLPYDDFLTWQLAGDLLPHPTSDQVLATAFNRIHRLNNEGGAVFEEWRIENVADRVHTVGTAILGLTLECCRCHDHKYDPISMRDYYSLSAFFNSIDESGVYDRTQKVPCPSMLLPTGEQSEELRAAKIALVDAESQYASARSDARRHFRQRSATVGLDSITRIPDLQLACGFDREFDNSLKPSYHPSQSDRAWTTPVDLVAVEDCDIPAIDPASLIDKPETATNTGNLRVTRLALQLDGERGITIKDVEPFERWMGFSVVMTLRDVERSPLRSIIAHHTRGTDCGYNGWDLAIADGYLDVRFARVWPGNAISVRSTKQVPHDAWCQIATTYDGSSRAAGIKLYLNGELLPTRVLRDELKKQCNVKVDHGGQLVIGQRFRSRGFSGGLVDDFRLFGRTLSSAEVTTLSTGRPQSNDLETYITAQDEACRNALKSLGDARKRFVMAEESMVEIPVMQELESPRPAHILARGQYDAPTDESTRVGRNVPLNEVLPLPKTNQLDRLTLAKWVTDPRHPLTARVAVNRFWGNFFPAPLVGTPENLGLQGDLPSHPKLLDWLARDFVDSGWDVKRLCQQIVLSATYRQDSRTTKAALEADPENRLLARGPAHRLSAEQIRDVALAASGLLTPAVGGPPVSPYQPGGDLWRESNGMSPPYQQSVGKALHRRSLYSVWKRTAPLPNMLAFDSTTREVCTMKRSRTNTPLQALVLLNDTQFVEAARVMASSLLKQFPHADACIESAFVRLTGRTPRAQEREVLQQLHVAELNFYQSHPEAAAAIIAVGETEAPQSIDKEEVAAMTVVCQAILNLDATIWKR
ncbi:MAG: DUF1553 domain-containing protein [Planctomycetota bacterium]